MTEPEKLKRKQKPRRWRNWRIGVYLALLGVLFVVIFLLTLPMCGCSISLHPSEFERQSTQIAATNAFVAELIQQTNVAATQTALP